MTNKKSTKRALLFSLLALVVCVSMLVGSTYAWFTDTVTSTNNKIQSGTLKVDLELLDKETGWNSVKDSHAPIFNYDKWEPGYVDVKVLRIENEGTLALKWVAKFVSEKQLSSLADVIDVYVLPTSTEPAYPDERTDISGWTYAGTLSSFINTIEETTKGILQAGEEQYLSIALKMKESAGNDYQTLSIGSFDIQIVATQLNFESDSFDENYDIDSLFPEIIGKEKDQDEITLTKKGIAVTVPEGAPAAFYELEIPSKNITTTGNTTVVSFDANLLADGGKVEDESISYTVQVDVGNYLDIIKVTHNGREITQYDYENGIVTFTTNSFSPFTVEYVNASEDFDVTEDGKITSGLFTVNPVNFDKSLGEADSEYIAVNYEMDGETVFEVIKRDATTVIAGPASYVPVNKNYTVRTVSGNMYSIFQSIANNEHSTVYILPGTYNEATAITVSSSVDIIGLGDKEDIKIVKVAGSKSNRHLFNVSGTKEDYIDVTISNMSLSVTVKNLDSSGKYTSDNAAVQSIRKSKVKCYDLNIEKDNGQVFYVNGNNKVDNVQYTAYMYVEDCTLTTTATYNILSTNPMSTSSPYWKFSYYNLKYANGEKNYTSTNTNTKNVQMSADDWDWLS